MVVKFRPDGSVAMTLGRKEEPLDWLEKFVEEGEHLEGTPNARPWVFNRPTDVTWDTEGNIFVSDGYNNSRLAKFDKNGNWVKAHRRARQRARPVQHAARHHVGRQRATSTSPTAATVASRSTRRICKRPEHHRGHGRAVVGVRQPGATQYLFSGDGNGKIYKIDPRRQAARLGTDVAGPRADRLPRARTALRIRDRPLQGRLLDLDGREDHHRPVTAGKRR